MSWKNWPSWLKGGVIGIILAILIILIILGLEYLGANSKIFAYIILPWSLIMITSHDILGLPGIGLIISWFVIGSIIGWIYNKIKSKEEIKMKAWLKGGLIGIIVGILFIITGIVFSYISIIISPLAFIISKIMDILFPYYGQRDNLFRLFFPIISSTFITFFIIGSLIGFIIDKFKSKSKKKRK